MKYIISVNVCYVPKEISQKLKKKSITHPKILFAYCQTSEYLETSRWLTVILTFESASFVGLPFKFGA